RLAAQHVVQAARLDPALEVRVRLRRPRGRTGEIADDRLLARRLLDLRGRAVEVLLHLVGRRERADDHAAVTHLLLQLRVGPAACASATTGTSAPTRVITAAIFRLIGRLPWLSNLHPYDARTSTLDAGVADAVPPTPSAPQTDVVRQLVDVVGTPRKEAREAGPHLRDGADDGAADGARAEPLDHPVAHASPVVVAHAGMDALVADDRELAVLDREIDEDAGAMGGAVHGEGREDLARALHGVGGAPAQAVPHPALDVHADLGRGPPLARPGGGRGGPGRGARPRGGWAPGGQGGRRARGGARRRSARTPRPPRRRGRRRSAVRGSAARSRRG